MLKLPFKTSYLVGFLKFAPKIQPSSLPVEHRFFFSTFISRSKKNEPSHQMMEGQSDRLGILEKQIQQGISTPNQIKSFQSMIEDYLQKRPLNNVNIKDIKQPVTNDLKELNTLIRILMNYKKLTFKEKKAIRKSMVSLIEHEISNLNFQLSNLDKQNIIDSSNKTFVDCLFKIFSLVYSQNLHTQKVFELGIKNLFKPEVLFEGNTLKRFPLAVMYMNIYGKGQTDTQSYNYVIKYLKENFQKIFTNGEERDITTIVDAISLDKSTDPELKALIFSASCQKIEKNEFTTATALKLFAFFSRGNFFKKDKDVKVFEAFFQKNSITALSNEDFVKAIFHLTDILSYSRNIGNQIIDILTRRSDMINDTIFKALLTDYNPDKYPHTLLDFLNKFVANNHQRLSLGNICAFMFHLVKNKSLDLKLFPVLENHICQNATTFHWDTIDLHHLMWSCVHLKIFDSKIFETLKPIIVKHLLEESTPEKFYPILWETAQSNLVIDLDTMSQILTKLVKTPNLIDKNDIKGMSTLFYSLALLVVKSNTFLQKDYQDKYKGSFEYSFARIISKVESCLDYQRFLGQDLESQVKLFQFFLTLSFEFPKLIEQSKISNQIIDHFKKEKLKYPGTPSNLMIDIMDVLRRLNIEFEKEKRVYVYLVDIFIKPNLAVEIEGVTHFSRNTYEQRHSDLLKEYHLEKLGYKIIKIPFFEFNQYTFTEMEKRKEYIYNKIFGTNGNLLK